MARDKLDYTHGDVGTKPTESLDFNKDGRPKAQYFDWWWYNVAQILNGHADEFGNLDSNNDGVVDKADNSDKVGGNTYSEIQTWVQENAKVSDSDNADSAVNADKLDGNHYSDIQAWVNQNADVPNADHADTAGKVEGTDGTSRLGGQLPSYATKADAQNDSDVTEGTIVYIEDQNQAYIEDGT